MKLLKNNIKPFEALPVLMLVLSVGIRVIYCAAAGMDSLFDWFSVLILPVLSSMIVCAGILSNKKPVVFAGVCIGCLFFIIKALDFGTVQLILCVLLYIIVGIIFYLSMFGRLSGNKLLSLLLGVTFAVHFVWDIYDIAVKNYPDILSFLPELSVLFIILSLFVYSMGLKGSKK